MIRNETRDCLRSSSGDRRQRTPPGPPAAATLRTVIALCSLMLVTLAGCRLGPRPSDQGTGPVITIAAVTGSAAAGTPLQFTVNAQPAPADDLTVHLMLDADACMPAATPPGTMLPSTITVTIRAGEQEATFSLQTTDLQVGPDGCSVTVTIADGDGYQVGDTAMSAGVMIAAGANPPQVPETVVTIAAAADTVPEGTDVSFTLTATPAPASPLTVNLSWTQSGSFLSGALPPTVTVPPSGTATVSASTDDDSTDEPNGSVTLTVDNGTVDNGTGYTVGSPGSATVMVTDDDTGTVNVVQPQVTIAAGPATVAEGTAVSFTLTAAPAPASALTVNLSWTQSGTFLTGARPATVTIPPAGTATVSASTADDSTDEPNGSVTLTVASGTGYTVGSPGSATVMVTDDDTGTVNVVQPQVTIAAGPATVAEGTAVSFTLTAAPAPASALTVNLSWTQSGTFLTGARPATVTIPPAGTATVSASTADDSTDEPNGSVTLTVASGSGYAVGSPSSATVTVTDNDVPQVTIAAGPATVAEGTAVSFTLTAVPAPASALTVNLSWTQSGTFLTGARPATVTIPPAGTATVSASTDDDSTVEPNGSVTLTVASGTGYTVGSPSSATVTVTDNDIPTFERGDVGGWNGVNTSPSSERQRKVLFGETDGPPLDGTKRRIILTDPSSYGEWTWVFRIPSATSANRCSITVDPAPNQAATGSADMWGALSALTDPVKVDAGEVRIRGEGMTGASSNWDDATSSAIRTWSGWDGIGTEQLIFGAENGQTITVDVTASCG